MLWLVIAMVLMAVFNSFAPNEPSGGNEIGYSEFVDEYKNGDVEEVLIKGKTIHGKYFNGSRFFTNKMDDPGLVNDLLKYNVKFKSEPEKEPGLLVSVFINWFPLLLLIGVWIFFMRQMQGGGGRGALSFGKSRARMLTEDKNKVDVCRRRGCRRSQGRSRGTGRVPE